MNELYTFKGFRVINTGDDPSKVSTNIIVQKKVGDEWERVAGFNSLSDDYAYSNARDLAQRMARNALTIG